MEIQFEPVITLEQSFNCLNIGNEPDNQLMQYGITEDRQINDKTIITSGTYNNLVWQNLPATITAQLISKLGVKTFPQTGACAYANLLYEDRSIIVAPVFPKNKRYDAPVLSVTALGDNVVRIVCTSPSNVTYDCFRVIFRKQTHAEEFILYDNTLDVTLNIGTYIVSAFGYLDENVASMETYIPEFVVTGIEIQPPNISPTLTEVMQAISAALGTHDDSHTSHQYIQDLIASGGGTVDPQRLVPPGGTKDQALVKSSDTNYDLTWKLTGGGTIAILASSFLEATANKTLTLNVQATLNATVIATVTTRSDTTFSESWQIIAETPAFSDSNQKLFILAKTATSTLETLIVTQIAEARVYAQMISLNRLCEFVVVQNYVSTPTALSKVTMTSKAAGECILYTLSAESWSGGNRWTTSPNDIQALSVMDRHATFFDWGGGSTTAHEFTQPSTSITGALQVKLF